VATHVPTLGLAALLLVALGYWVSVRLGGVVEVPATSARPAPHLFVGRTCLVCTSRLGPTYGRAEVTTAGGPSTDMQVRLAGKATHAAGWTVLIYGYDPTGNCFWVTPIDVATLPD
jgi:hypothetical protein